MCTTNDQATQILKGIRKIDSEKIENFNDTELSELYTKIYTLQKELESYQDLIKPELIKRNIPQQYFPCIEKKIYLAEGNNKSVYNVENIFKAANDNGLINDFFASINYISSKASENLQKIADANCKVIPSDEKVLKVLKMNKKELLEHKIK